MSSSIPWLYPVEVTRSYPSLHCDTESVSRLGWGKGQESEALEDLLHFPS